jgi:hypothetical protein
MRFPLKRVAFLSALAGLVSPGHAQEATSNSPWQTDWTLKPSVLRATAAKPYFVPALKLGGSLKREFAPAIRDDLILFFDAKGTLAARDEANSENLYAAAHAGLSHTFHQSAPIAPLPPPGQRRGVPLPTVEPSRLSALLDLWCNARVEADQSFRNSNFTFGPHLGLTPGFQTGYAYLLPSLYLDFGYVDVLRSAVNRRLGVSDDGYWRSDLSAGWSYPFGSLHAKETPWLRPVDLQADVQWTHTYDQPAAKADSALDHSVYVSGTIGYNLRSLHPEHPARLSAFLPYLYVSLAHGRLPPVEKNQTMLFLGFVYGRGK